ncbi:MAG TPA: SAM-dependent chlorinase/fluorinase [bacterium]|nr:SAM-dependent chlorinase/fluorinase [bacterium]
MRLLTFLSDFGLESPYPAAMKAVAAGICDARFVDISHAVPPHAVRTGAYLLWSVAPACPAGTVHCAVVDPGVGTARAPLAVASAGHIFVGPDNGLLLPAAKRLGTPRVYRLTNAAYRREPVSATFHGRDVFAPAAAHLAAGVALDEIGTPAPGHVDLILERAEWDGPSLRGEVLWIDPFGNILTTIPGQALAGLPAGREISVEVQKGGLRATAGRTFGDVAPGAAVVLTGSDGFVEIALNRARAASLLGAAPGDPVWLRPADIGS